MRERLMDNVIWMQEQTHQWIRNLNAVAKKRLGQLRDHDVVERGTEAIVESLSGLRRFQETGKKS